MQERSRETEERSGIEMGEAEPWEPWETKLVMWSIGIGLVVLVIGGILIDAFILGQ